MVHLFRPSSSHWKRAVLEPLLLQTSPAALFSTATAAAASPSYHLLSLLKQITSSLADSLRPAPLWASPIIATPSSPTRPDQIYLYNTIIKALSNPELATEAILLYNRILASDLRFDTYSLPFVLKALFVYWQSMLGGRFTVRLLGLG
ncbi:hypothetical protein CK203_105251 [Vitis vinifera]|uniref:Pentatricopeptide repeat-containing protein n=1 Tax=Vitis vinifera TaxID=29760 RepID=A0A438C5N2_VITVI|nr:hypothetical protein CK203_105251 [Vitis vinifera]